MSGRIELLSGPAEHASLLDTSTFLSKMADLGGGGSGDRMSHAELAAREAFRWHLPFVVARAPGRMDVMGGIADYSGSLVLQMPTAEACHAAVQRQAAGGGGRRKMPSLHIISFNNDPGVSRPVQVVRLPLEDLLPGGKALAYADAKAYFQRDPAMHWAAYIGGCLVVLATEEAAGEGGCVAGDGESLVVLVSSDVPEGKGVSSSASVEVATMSAVAAAYGINLEGRRLAILCQKVENLVVGAPCGIMDQMASALGQPGTLLALLCQPAEVQGCVAVPTHARFWGIDSGKAHSVGGADYGSVRVGAFMGLRIAGGGSVSGAAESSTGNPPPLGGYLATLSPNEFEAHVCAGLPEALTGAEFLETYGAHLDTVTTVDPGKRYAVRVPSAHPVYEHFRVRTFRQALLAAADAADGVAGAGIGSCGGAAAAAAAAAAASVAPTAAQAEQMSLLGELMLQSHASYSACGLGSQGTDRLVALVKEEMDVARACGEAPPVFGAKITGGGSGGTVCVLAAACPAGDAAVRRVTAAYASELGYAPKVFQGSSMGAVAFGALTVRVVLSLP
ncbi:hypothetical protein FOA52_001311 [Chlamydomonas sp. UWO 241]|nr:hypothetical protein FOA52_001311 [Chlamydomonas sp. UWO 241]